VSWVYDANYMVTPRPSQSRMPLSRMVGACSVVAAMPHRLTNRNRCFCQVVSLNLALFFRPCARHMDVLRRRDARPRRVTAQDARRGGRIGGTAGCRRQWRESQEQSTCKQPSCDLRWSRAQGKHSDRNFARAGTQPKPGCLMSSKSKKKLASTHKHLPEFRVPAHAAACPSCTAGKLGRMPQAA